MQVHKESRKVQFSPSEFSNKPHGESTGCFVAKRGTCGGVKLIRGQDK